MKKIFTLLTILVVTAGMANAQQVIGSFSTMDGGFESLIANPATATSIAVSTQTTNWTVTTTAGTATTLVTSGARTGVNYVTYGSPASSNRRLQSPTATSSAVAGSTQYVIQFYYKTSGATAPTNTQIGASNDGTSSPGTYVSAALSGTSGTWTKFSGTVTSGNGASSPRYGIAIIRYSAASAITSFDIDDVVMYAGSSADVSAPNAATVPVFSNVTTSSQDVSWTAASGGVDGGGYMVVRGIVDPTTTPNANGIYAIGNTVAAGETVVYVGSATTFTDNTLLENTNYFYRIYTVDKAFNYSTALTANNATALPISLVKFTADKLSEKVKLNWVTATEINNDKFIIERSADGENFELVSEVKGAGNSREINSYNVVDADPLKGTSYYRLTQVDFNGASETFAPVAVNMSGKLHLATVQSNTEAGNIDMSIYSPSATSTAIRVLDLSGRTIASQQVNLVEGYQSVNINTNNLSSGIHIIQIMNGEEVVMKKLVL
jgi:hypothetical protein